MRVAEVTAPSLVQHLSGGGGERLRLHFEAEEGREFDTGAAFTHTHTLTHTVSAPHRRVSMSEMDDLFSPRR